MKTLKTIITTTILLFALTSAQQTQAQTKEETIAWIKSKVFLFARGVEGRTISNVNVTPCNFSYTINFRVDNETETITFPVTDVERVYVQEEQGHCVIKLGAKTVHSDSEYNRNRGLTYMDWVGFHNGEKDIAFRMEKALKHLATFCETKKETF